MGEDQSADKNRSTPIPESAEAIPKADDQNKTRSPDAKNDKPKTHHRSVRQRWATMSLPNKLMAVATIFIAIATIVNVCIAYAQWIEMDESGAQTSRLIHLYRWQLTRLSRQAADTHELAAQAGKQAANTETLAIAAVQSTYLGQRAWMFPQEIYTELPSKMYEVNKPLIVRITFHNTGRSPATNVRAITIASSVHSPNGVIPMQLPRAVDYSKIKPVFWERSKWKNPRRPVTTQSFLSSNKPFSTKLPVTGSTYSYMANLPTATSSAKNIGPDSAIT